MITSTLTDPGPLALAAGPADKSPEMPLAGLCFLVVEDHDFQRETMRGMLNRLGARAVFEAADGQAALDLVQTRQRPVDIIITDLDMPGVDGMEFIRRLGESGSSASLIITSSLDAALIGSVQTMAAAYGMTLLGAIEKPATPKKLTAMIQHYQPVKARPDRSRTAAPAFTVDEIVAGLKNDEFEPFFQPKIELATGRVAGAEALARWRHPQKGIVAPFAFIKLLEDHDLINELTWVMLKKAAASCTTWHAEGLDATVSVNLSPKSLTDVKLADRITQLVRGQNLDPRHMMLELTESAATTEVGKALENLSRLRMNGFGLSIDDYGTGYSSMQQLTRVAFTELKIDQSFLRNAARQEACMVILKSSLQMATKLKIAAVAEGIETQEDLDLLRSLGGNLVQGYFLAKPMAADAFLGWAREWERSHS